MSAHGIPVTFPIEENTLRRIVVNAKDWALTHGVAIRPGSNPDLNTMTVAPFTLFPSPIPKKDFEELTRLQPALNLLTHKVAHDHSFLEETLSATIQCDEFTRKLYEIYETVRNEGFAQDVSLGVFRSDYLPDSVRSLYQQVEFNTVASSFPALSVYVQELQSYILEELGYGNLLTNMPENDALHLTCLGIVKAWEHYQNDNALVIFVVEDTTNNICDQRFMEYEVRKIQPKIKTIRISLTDEHCYKLGNDKQLLVNGQEVAVVYYRVGYDPAHYKDVDWSTRLLIERSRAIKCPSIQYHLAGTKKVQQMLAMPKVVEKYIKDPAEAKAVRKLFAEIYSLDLNEEGNAAYNLALRKPENYVLKPQREGGGNNVYGDDIPSYLKSLGDDRQAYILMGLISPQPTRNYLISKSSGEVPTESSVVSEFGIYGVILGSKDEILANYQAGHMLRTKSSTSREGGVAVGSGFLDSPYLV